jgi:hypothetical protein
MDLNAPAEIRVVDGEMLAIAGSQQRRNEIKASQIMVSEFAECAPPGVITLFLVYGPEQAIAEERATIAANYPA